MPEAADGALCLIGQEDASSEFRLMETLLPVRMGLATGEVLRNGDYFGTVLNRAARVMAAGHGGQDDVWASHIYPPSTRLNRLFAFLWVVMRQSGSRTLSRLSSNVIARSLRVHG
jgi:class 3 adenylate cyclase